MLICVKFQGKTLQIWAGCDTQNARKVMMRFGAYSIPFLTGLASFIGPFSLYNGGYSTVYAAAKSQECSGRIQILHTNDIHSHFRPAKDALNLGGVARLKTKIVEMSAPLPDRTLLVDGGDFSEGEVYYNLGAGVETLKMLGHLGYDFAVVGNHDWLNGPDILLNAVETASKESYLPPPTLLSGNLDLNQYAKKTDFEKWIKPYFIREIAGARIAFVGLSTFEKIYDTFFKPVKIKDPVPALRAILAELKSGETPLADEVIVISHHHSNYNKKLLAQFPEINLIIGGHDHELYTEAVTVERNVNGTPQLGYLVEAGEWGQFLGQVYLSLTPTSAGCKVAFDSSRVIQIDGSIPEDAETLRRIESLEAKLEALHGPIFHTPVSHLSHEITRTHPESQMGNLVTDAIRATTGADIAIDQIPFIYGSLPSGRITLADVYSALPAVYSPLTQKAWTISLMPIKGKTLSWLIYFFLRNETIRGYGLPSVSGMEIVLPEVASDPIGILIQGKPIENEKLYLMSMSGGVANALRYLNTLIPSVLPIRDLKDTGIETWSALAGYLEKKSSWSPALIAMGRVRKVGADLRLWESDIEVKNIERLSQGKAKVDLQIRLTNLGSTPLLENGFTLNVLERSNGLQFDKPSTVKPLITRNEFAPLLPLQEVMVPISVELPLYHSILPIHVQVQSNSYSIEQPLSLNGNEFRVSKYINLSK